MEWRSTGRLMIGAHRGASAHAPENTMAAFRLAAEAGADYLELDVHLAADGIPVVVHDDDLLRTTGRSGLVASMGAAELSGHGVPLLAEVLLQLEASAGLGATIEAKGAATGGPIAAAIAASPARERLSICSFDARELAAARRIAPDVPRILIVDRDERAVDLLALARSTEVDGLNAPIAWLDANEVGRLHAVVLGGTVDDADGIRLAADLGVDAVDSNDPALTVRARDALTIGVH